MKPFAPNGNMIQDALVGGFACEKFTVTEANRAAAMNNGGTVKWGERATRVQDGPGCIPDSVSVLDWMLYVPGELQPGTTMAMFLELHLVSKGVSWACYFLDQILRFIVEKFDTNGNVIGEALRVDIPYTRDAWVKGNLYQEINGPTKTGKWQMTVNGVVIANYSGMLVPSQDVLDIPHGVAPGMQHGLYCIQPMPTGVKQMSIYMRYGLTPWAA